MRRPAQVLLVVGWCHILYSSGFLCVSSHYFILPRVSSEKAMAPHSSTLAWKIPWTEEPGRLQSMGSLGVGHDWVTSLSRIGKGNGNPPQCSCLENPRDGTGESRGLPSMGSHRVRHNWSDLAAAAGSQRSWSQCTHSKGSGLDLVRNEDSTSGLLWH